MAIQTVKNNQNVTVGATEDELVLLPPFSQLGQVTLKQVSGSFKACIGGPTNDTSLRAYTSANDTCVLTVNSTSQWDTANRIHVVGTGVFTITY